MEGAEPGDTLVVEVLDIHTVGWGWTAVIPGFGLLADDFPEPYLNIFDLSNGDFTLFKEDIAIPIEPFFGTMGVSPERPREARRHAARPLRRQHGHAPHHQGQRLFLPVQVPGRSSPAATPTPPRATARSA